MLPNFFGVWLPNFFIPSFLSEFTMDEYARTYKIPTTSFLRKN